MILSYGTRLVFLIAASFYLVHLATGLAAILIAPVVRRRVERLPASTAEAVLLALRLLPPVAALLAVAVFCVPSYLRLETNEAPEFTGAGCLIAALLGFTVSSLSIGRAALALVRSRRYFRLGREATSKLTDFPWTAFVVESPAPCFALAGIFRPRLIVSRAVLRRLNREQLAVALSHEQAHQRSLDNLRRLLVLLMPGLFPGIAGFGALEHEWERFLEWSADDRAVSGNPQRAIALASALLGVARMAVESNRNLLVCSLVSGTRDLSDRVDRLLDGCPVAGPPSPSIRRALTVAAGTGVLALALGQSAALPIVHGLLEHLMR